MELEPESHLESFLRWAAELGISDSFIQSFHPKTPTSCLGHSLSISNFPDAGGRGLAAVRDLRKGELILRVPKSALITREAFLKDDNLSLAVRANPSLSSTQILTVSLLAEMGKGKSSWWHPYLMQLPRSYDLLASFGQYETQALQVDEAMWSTERAISRVESEWKQTVGLLHKLGLKHQLITLRAWLWASATISSRTLHVPWDDAGCLCPVGDLFNYAAPGEETDFEGSRTQSNASGSEVNFLENEQVREKLDSEQFYFYGQRLVDAGYEEDDAAYCFYARRNYKRGEQILLSYGTYTNLELLEHYGFLLDDNPNDKVFFHLQPEILSCSSWPTDSIYIAKNGHPSFALLCALRLWATSPSQRRSVRHLAYSGSQLSPENEISVMNSIVANCSNILKNLPTSVEEDCLSLHTINKIQGSCTPVELKILESEFEGEICMFLEANCLQTGEGSGREMFISKRARRTMDRWKLAVQWRMRYKKTLVDCIHYCSQVINSLSRDT